MLKFVEKTVSNVHNFCTFFFTIIIDVMIYNMMHIAYYPQKFSILICIFTFYKLYFRIYGFEIPIKICITYYSTTLDSVLKMDFLVKTPAQIVSTYCPTKIIDYSTEIVILYTGEKICFVVYFHK